MNGRDNSRLAAAVSEGSKMRLCAGVLPASMRTRQPAPDTTPSSLISCAIPTGPTPIAAAGYPLVQPAGLLSSSRILNIGAVGGAR